MKIYLTLLCIFYTLSGIAEIRNKLDFFRKCDHLNLSENVRSLKILATLKDRFLLVLTNSIYDSKPRNYTFEHTQVANECLASIRDREFDTNLYFCKEKRSFTPFYTTYGHTVGHTTVLAELRKMDKVRHDKVCKNLHKCLEYSANTGLGKNFHNLSKLNNEAQCE